MHPTERLGPGSEVAQATERGRWLLLQFCLQHADRPLFGSCQRAYSRLRRGGQRRTAGEMGAGKRNIPTPVLMREVFATRVGMRIKSRKARWRIHPPPPRAERYPVHSFVALVKRRCQVSMCGCARGGQPVFWLCDFGARANRKQMDGAGCM